MRALTLAALLVLAVPAVDLAAQMGGVVVDGDVSRPYTMTAETFRKLDPNEVLASIDGAAHSYRAVPLHCFLEEAGMTFGDALRGPLMAATVVVEGRDGYRVVFSLASLDEQFGGEVYLADAVDGGLLGPDQGPYRLIVPGDARATRWVRQVAKVTVRAAPAGN